MITLAYEWEQTDTLILVNVLLPVGIGGAKCDVKIGVEMISIAAPGNHILRLWLHGPVNRGESTLVLKPSRIELVLKKQTSETWPRVTHENASDKRLLTQTYQALLDTETREQEERAKKARIEARAKKDSSVNAQITNEQVKRAQRDTFKSAEKAKIEAQIKAEAAKKEESSGKEIQFGDSVPSYRKPPGTTEKTTRKSKMAAPRQRGQITVSFTERSFPTPVRESRLPEEDEWLAKQARARKAADDFEADLAPNEREVGYLEEKGIKMMKNGDCAGALNAFNTAIKLFPAVPSCYMHRAALQLKQRNAIYAAQDAARALEMLIPPVPANLSQRINCHLLRGRALRTLEMFTEALMDFTEAIKLDPKDATIEQEADQVRKIIESNGDTWKEEWETDLLAN